MKDRILNSINKGIKFLFEKQLNSGEFSTMRAIQQDMQGSIYIKSSFLTTFILHSLNFLKNKNKVKIMINKGIDYLLAEKEKEGFWRFFGKKTRLPLDLDSTCTALACLYVNNVKLNYQRIAEKILKYRDENSLFFTWILNRDLPKNFQGIKNNIDCTVNANALFFYSLMKFSIPEVVNYHSNIIKKNRFHENNVYYLTPMNYYNCLTRAYSEGGNLKLKPILKKIKNILLLEYHKDTNKWNGNTLDNAMGIISLLNCGYKGTDVDRAISSLLEDQKINGSWPNSAFFQEVVDKQHKYYYGSEELTTALAMEALYKYARLNVYD